MDKVCQGCPDRFDDCITKAKSQELVEQARKEVAREIFELLDLHENELGFCEISNHVPWQSLEEKIKE